jgi:UDPglucose 6-dehydrogenase
MRVSVVGLGKLGLPLAALLASSGHQVSGFDVSSDLRRLLASRKFDYKEPQLNELLERSHTSLKIVDSVEDAVKDSEIVFVIVPTPSLTDGEFSNEFVLSAVKDIGHAIAGKNSRIVIDIVSTVMPKSCSGVISRTLETSSGRSIGESLGLCYNPEFIALGSVINDMEYPDMHLIGQSSDWAGELVEDALRTISRRAVPAVRMSLTEAELVKIAVNNFITMKISYANILYQAALSIGDINIDTVTHAIGLDSRIGAKYLRAAAPYGGPCFPRDTRALSFLFRELGLVDSLSHATDQANKNHVTFISHFVQQSLNKGTTVGIAGISYKTGTQVIEESPGIAIAKVLLANGNQVRYWDDEGSTLPTDSTEFRAVDSADELIRESDYILVSRPLNDTNQFYNLLRKHGKPFLDLWRQL